MYWNAGLYFLTTRISPSFLLSELNYYIHMLLLHKQYDEISKDEYLCARAFLTSLGIIIRTVLGWLCNKLFLWVWKEQRLCNKYIFMSLETSSWKNMGCVTSIFFTSLETSSWKNMDCVTSIFFMSLETSSWMYMGCVTSIFYMSLETSSWMYMGCVTSMFYMSLETYSWKLVLCNNCAFSWVWKRKQQW